MTALEFAAWMLANVDAKYEVLQKKFQSLVPAEQLKLKAAMNKVKEGAEQ